MKKCISALVYSVVLAFISVTGYEAQGAITRQVWTGIGGRSILELTSQADYPNNPDIEDELSIFEAPSNWDNNYGTRIVGYLHPPVTGSYTFWIASDDHSALFLGVDDQEWTKQRIAYLDRPSSQRGWTDHSTQQSLEIELEAGKRYFIEALHKENGGLDYVAVAWQRPGGNREVIPGTYLSPFDGQTPSQQEKQLAFEEALSALDQHIQGVAVLSDSEIASNKSIIENLFAEVDLNESTIKAAFDLVTSYETHLGPMFMNEATTVLSWGWDRRTFEPTVHTAILSVMQAIIDLVYTAENLSAHKNIFDGYKFESSDYFPGKVRSIPDPNEVHSATINGSYLKTFGHLVMHAEKPAVKPTGTYLAPGSIATVTVPQSLVGKGYTIRVGAHGYDVSNKPFVRRLDRSSITYEINHMETEVASPLGGGIYIEVPYLADAGIVDVQIKNAVRSPFYSMKSFHKTSLAEWQNVERKHGAPWADFQTDKFMMQVPTSWIYNYDNPEQLMKDWDSAMDAVNDLMGYPHDRGKETLYLQVDVIIKAGAYSPGYPQVNVTYNPRDAYDRHRGNNGNGILKGPHHIGDTEFHELGHGYLCQKFPGETEAMVNLLTVPVLNRKFEFSLDEAFRRSFSGNRFVTLDHTAITWMTSENFRQENQMVGAEMQYQHKGYAKYVEVAKQFGWTVLGDYWRSINQDYEDQNDPYFGPVKNIDQSNNGLILRMSKAAGYDLAPLIHFWGTHPNDIPAMKATMSASNIPPSAKIYDMLVRYKAMVPANNQAFRNFAQQWWEKQPSPSGYMTEAYHAQMWNAWNESYATQIRGNVQNIIDLYFSDGRPDGQNTAPVANDQRITTTQNRVPAITLTGRDPDDDPLRYQIVSQPTHGTLSGNAPNLTYAPEVNYIGDDSFTFSVNDNIIDSAVATVSITIAGDGNTDELISVSFDTEARTERELDGPIFGTGGSDVGTTWNQILHAKGWFDPVEMTINNLRDASGANTTVDFETDSYCMWPWGAPDLKMLTSGLFAWESSEVQTMKLKGLTSGQKYDLYLASFHPGGTGNRALFSTENASSTVGTQIADSGGEGGNDFTWIRGENYVVFEDVEPNAANEIIVTYVSDSDANAYLSGFQLAPAGTSLLPPGPAMAPKPKNGAVGLSPNTDLSWTAGSSTDSFEVYVGTDPTPDGSELKGNQSGTTFDPGTLPIGTYYWRIDAVNDEGTTPGPVWSFTVGSPGKALTPMPYDNMLAVKSGSALKWAMGERALSSKVYFGTDSTPDAGELKGNQISTTFNPGTLLPETTYYWRIDQINAQGTTTGDVWSFTTPKNSENTVKIFILAGQSNMEGHGEVTPVGTPGTLENLFNSNPTAYAHLKEGNNWAVRDDVWIHYKRGGTTLLSGGLSVGYGAYDHTIGPELQFGHLMGDLHDEQVLIIKTAWGGKSLAVDFRPPRAGWRKPMPEEAGDDGYYYQEIMDAVVDAMNNLEAYFPAYNGQGFEVAGFGWHQGWNDAISDEYSAEYEQNMQTFIKDVRASLGVPNMPFVIGSSGLASGSSYNTIELAQIAMGDETAYPEFEGNVAVSDTTDFLRSVEESPSSQGHHWNRNAESYYLVGNSMGLDMTDLLTNEKPPATTYTEWATANGIGSPLADDDGDGRNNFYEYALGGNPKSSADTINPTISMSGANFEYRHRKRNNDSSLNYQVEVCRDLVSGVWVDLETVPQTDVIGGSYDEVIHAIPTTDAQSYIRLIISTR